MRKIAAKWLNVIRKWSIIQMRLVSCKTWIGMYLSLYYVILLSSHNKNVIAYKTKFCMYLCKFLSSIFVLKFFSIFSNFGIL